MTPLTFVSRVVVNLYLTIFIGIDFAVSDDSFSKVLSLSRS